MKTYRAFLLLPLVYLFNQSPGAIEAAGTLKLNGVPTLPSLGGIAPAYRLDPSNPSDLTLSGRNVTSLISGGTVGGATAGLHSGMTNATLTAANPAFGGRPTLHFGGNSAYDISQTAMNAIMGGTPYTIFAVERVVASGGAYQFLGTNSSNPNQGLQFGYRSTNDFFLGQFNNDLDWTGAPGYPGSQVARLWTGKLDTSSGHYLHYNGAQEASNNNTTPLTVSTNGIIGTGWGYNSSYVGDLGEVLIYNSALSDANRNAVESYLTSKWITGGSNALPAATPLADAPGRQVKVSAIAIGCGGDYRQKLKLAIDHLEVAGKNGVDLACLPEWFCGSDPEPIDGPTVHAIAELARRHKMYVVCSIREQATDGKRYNTTVLLDREGKVTGYYRKVFVFWGEGLNVSRDGVKAFDTDFGRIAIFTCFDANFDELWSEAERKGAEIVVWPSAYGGGMPLNGYAMIHNYFIVPVGTGNIIDLLGQAAPKVQQPKPQQFIATLDLDRTLLHQDFTTEKVSRLLNEHKGEVEMEKRFDMENWFSLRAVKPGVRVRDLCKKYQIETLREYRQRSRQQINQVREKGAKI